MPDPVSAATAVPDVAIRRRKRRLLAWMIAIDLLVLAVVWLFFFQTYHLMTVQPGVLYRDGNRGLREFRTAIRQAAPRTVVCLVHDDEVNDPKLPMFKQEFAFLKDRGIRLVRIPMRTGAWPTQQDVDQFLSLVQEKANQPVLVHCAQGMHRTGIMTAIYQMRVMGYTQQQAEQAIQTGGAGKRPRVAADLKRFIELYNPATGVVPTQSEKGTTGDD